MTSEETSRSRLGRGLAALIGDVDGPSDIDGAGQGRDTPRTVPIEFLIANAQNPRRDFDETSLDELAQSIRQKGILQPILVRPIDAGTHPYEIVAGERRWRAAQRAGLVDVPVVIQEFSDQEALEAALIENIQRSDLNPIEEALGYQKLMKEFSHTQSALAEIIGRSRSHVANTLRLLKLSDTVREHIEAGRLSAGHARALITSENANQLAERIIKNDLSVRDAENLSRKEAADGAGPRDAAATKPAVPQKSRKRDADTRMLEKHLSDALGLVVSIEDSGGKGHVRVDYTSLEQLDAICVRLRGH